MKFKSTLLMIWIINLLSTFVLVIQSAVMCAAASSMTEVTYFSRTMNSNRQMMVYLPDGYNQNTSYPTFYLMHGGNQRYYTWAAPVDGNAKYILDQAISTGKAVPMIVVMPDVNNFEPALFTRELCNDVVPYVEKTYKVRPDKDSRAIAGLSWGGLQVLDAGLYRYDLFGYLGVFSSGWFIGDNIYNVMNRYLSENGAKIEASMRYFYFGEGGRGDIAYNNGMETMKLIRSHGITVNYWEHSGGHSFVCWRQDLQDFLPFLFKEGLVTSADKKQTQGKLEVFPNPFANEVTISAVGVFKYKIFTALGKEVASGTGEGSQNINTELEEGMYLLDVETNEGHKVARIIKK